jgi:hypothetical protein
LLKINIDQRYIKKTTPKSKIYKDIKISLTAHCAKLGLTTKFVPWPNSYTLLFCCKYKYFEV